MTTNNNFLNYAKRTPVALGIAALVCLPINAVAATFTPTDDATLRADLLTAESNGTSDIIDLAGMSIKVFDEPLTYNGTGEGSLTIQNGELTARRGTSILQLTGSAAAGEVVAISDMTFSNGSNTTELENGQGGAIYSQLPLVINTTSFNTNSAEISGGAIYSTNSIQITNSYFTDNNAGDAGGAISGFAELTIDGSLFRDNTGNRGGALFTESSSSLAVTGSTFESNVAGLLGGAVFSKGSNPVSLATSTFNANESVSGGGALYFQSLAQSVEIERVTMWNNSGGGANGSAIRLFGTSIDLVNTFVGSNLDDDSSNCQLLSGSAITSIDSLSTDSSCGSSNTTLPEVFASFFGSINVTQTNVGRDNSEGLPVLIPAENGPLDDASGDVCVGLDQRGNAVADGLCDIGSVELLPSEQDTDSDGTNDEQDNCVLIANDQSENLDGDEFGDACDDDLDNDGTPNSSDAFPRDANEDTDTDGDTWGDNADNCPLVANIGQEDENSNGVGDMCEVPVCFGLAATIYVRDDNIIIGGAYDGDSYTGVLKGTSGDDVLVGTDNRDSIFGYDGNDVICSLGGNDIVRASTGDDILFGGEGDDDLRGAKGSDILYGEAGNDILYGGRQGDQLFGDDGDDTLYGHAGVDTLSGGAGNDVGDAGPHADVCIDIETPESCTVL